MKPLEIKKSNYNKIDELLTKEQLRRTNFRIDLDDILNTKEEAKRTIRSLKCTLKDYEDAKILRVPTHLTYDAKYSSKGKAFELKIIKGKFYLTDIYTAYAHYCVQDFEIILNEDESYKTQIFKNNRVGATIEGVDNIFTFKLKTHECIFDYKLSNYEDFNKLIEKLTAYFPHSTSENFKKNIGNYINQNTTLQRKLKLEKYLK